MKKYLVGAVAAAAVAAPLAVVAAPAEANSPCITRPEFTRIKDGQSLTTVGRIVGGKGAVSVSSGSFVIRSFKTCAAYHVSNVTFTDGRVSGKLYI